MGSDTKARPAYMHDADETGEPISGTRRTARQNLSGSQSQRRSEEKKKSKSDTGTKSYDHKLAGSKHAEEKEGKLERRRSSASARSPKKGPARPPSAHGNKNFPRVDTNIPTDHPSHFGIPTPTSSRGPPLVSQYPKMAQPSQPAIAQPIPHRPRAKTSQTYPARPVSYHAAYGPAPGHNYGPPVSTSGYYQPQMAAPSYPPPSPSSSYMHYAATPQPQEYFAPKHVPGGRSLHSRFELQRPSSAFAMRESPTHNSQIQSQIEDAYDAGYISASEGPLARRRSITRDPPRPSMRSRVETEYKVANIRPFVRSKAESDFDAMPPPPAPAPKHGILRNKTEYHIDPEPPKDRRHSRTMYREAPQSRRTSTNRNSVSYDLESDSYPVRVETANTSHRRRESYYGPSVSVDSGSGTGSPWEEQAKAAQSYQADVGATAPLTQEMLKRAQRRQDQGGSSRTSSGSHSESDYLKSATTRTTRSGNGQDHGDDTFTIKVKGGQARIRVDGAEIDCTDGGEVQVQRQKSIKNGSERSGSIYGSSQYDDRDRRPRGDQPSSRSRRSSVGGQFRRAEYHPGTDFTTMF